MQKSRNVEYHNRLSHNMGETENIFLEDLKSIFWGEKKLNQRHLHGMKRMGGCINQL